MESYDLALSAFACSCPKDAAKYNAMRTLNLKAVSSAVPVYFILVLHFKKMQLFFLQLEIVNGISHIAILFRLKQDEVLNEFNLIRYSYKTWL